MNVKMHEHTEKVVYLLRHGQSEANAAPVFQGSESPLSEHGKKQAQFIAKRVEKIDFDVLISSPFERAKQTADIISTVTKRPVEFSELFVERVKPSSVDGKPYTDAQASDVRRRWQKSVYTTGARVEDGENYDDITSRAQSALDYLYNRPEKRIVVASHGYFVRALAAAVLLGDGLTPTTAENFHKSMHGMENTGLTILIYEAAFEQEARWRLWIYNDHAHLAE